MITVFIYSDALSNEIAPMGRRHTSVCAGRIGDGSGGIPSVIVLRKNRHLDATVTVGTRTTSAVSRAILICLVPTRGIDGDGPILAAPSVSRSRPASVALLVMVTIGIVMVSA